MAFNRSLGVDIGTDSVKMVELVRARGKRKKIVVQNIIEAPIEAPHDAPAEARNTAIIQTVREMLKKHRIQTKLAVFSLPGQIAFTRRLPLPVTSPERLERIIRFEARQQIPFPPDQTAMHYQVFENTGRDQVDVLLVAIRRDLVNDYMQVLNRCNLQPVIISVSSFALFNYHVFTDRGMSDGTAGADKAKQDGKGKKSKGGKKGAFNLPFLKKKQGAQDEAEEPDTSPTEETPGGFGLDEMEEIKAYFNIGASTFDLSIHRRQAHNDTLGFVRSVPFGGNEITKAIQESCKIPNFSEADRIKRDNTRIVIPGFDLEDAEKHYNEAASKALDRPVKRIVSELRRSLDFYISQPDGVAVDSLTVSGGTAKLPNLTTFIEEKLGLPAEVHDQPPQAEWLEYAHEAPQDFSRYLIAFGLAVTGLEESKIRINFLPRAQQVNLEIKKKYVQLGFMVLLLVVMLAISSQIGKVNIRNYQSAIQSMKTQLDLIAKKEEQIKTVENNRSAVAKKFELLGRALPKNPDYWFEVYLAILNAKPPAVIFTELNFSALGSVTIKGLSQSVPSIPRFTNSLKEGPSAKFVKDARLMNVVERFDQELNRRVSYYEIIIELNQVTTQYQLAQPPAAPPARTGIRAGAGAARAGEERSGAAQPETGPAGAPGSPGRFGGSPAQGPGVDRIGAQRIPRRED